MPKAAVSMQNGTIEEWLVENGASVITDQPIYTLEIEKTVLEIESPATGKLVQKALAGESYKVGEIIGEIES
jgi:pyruvate/2-oxoglutarate dehydrogenase complex dihydrolipoamide acyltransferase (E2) component|tara:strand:- start:1008 stop:1223 length:216 start_codon:yes stop_codon:yes gene_type:complete